LDPNGDWILGIIDHSQKKSLKAGEKILVSWGIRFLVEGGSGTGVKPAEIDDLPKLHPVYPNPFNDETTIAFELFNASEVKLSVYNLQGKLVDELANERFPEGRFQKVWKAREHPAGSYIIRFESSGIVEFRKMIIAR